MIALFEKCCCEIQNKPQNLSDESNDNIFE